MVESLGTTQPQDTATPDALTPMYGEVNIEPLPQEYTDFVEPSAEEDEAYIQKAQNEEKLVGLTPEQKTLIETLHSSK